MLPEVVALLACPHCGGGFAIAGRTLTCDRGHAFDLARHGYVSLLPGAGARRGAGDTAAMVAARERFLAGGAYAGLAARLAALAGALDLPPGAVVEAGAGTAYYLARVLDRLAGRTGLAVDTSKYALRRAARAHPRAGAVAGDAWRVLPVRDGAAALLLDVFAPRNGAEFRRVLPPDGRLLVVTPAAEHLGELVGPLGLLSVDERKDERLAGTLDPYLDLVDRTRYEETLALGREAVRDLVTMTPSAHHVAPDEPARRLAAAPDPWPVTLAVDLSVYSPRPDPAGAPHGRASGPRLRSPDG